MWTKFLHVTFHLLAVPCGVFGFIAVYRHHNRHDPKPIPNFYSAHSWMGAAAMGVFGLQFLFGFMVFIVLLCCEKQSARLRAKFAPLHAGMGVAAFVLGVATACSGITQKIYASLGSQYSDWIPFATSGQVDSIPIVGEPENQDAVEPFTRLMFEEALTANVLVASLVLVAILLPCVVVNPRFRGSIASFKANLVTN